MTPRATRASLWPLLVACACLLLLAAPARAVTSPEIDLDFETYQADSGKQVKPAIAWNGASFLVVWRDNQFAPTGPGIRGVLVGADGAIPEPMGFLIAEGLDDSARPAVAADGATFLVVWHAGAAGSRDIKGVRVSAAGAVLDAAPLSISSAPDDQALPDVAAGGGGFFVVWQDGRGGGSNDIYGARVSAAGAVLDPAGVAVSSAPGDQAQPAVAHDGAGFVVAWDDLRSGASRDVYAARVSAAGAVLDPAGIAVSTAQSSQTSPDVASLGAGALVVWQDHRSGASHEIYGARLGPAGEVLDPAGLPISTAPGAQRHPSVAAGASAYLVAWEGEGGNETDAYGARVSPGGEVLDPAASRSWGRPSTRATSRSAPRAAGGSWSGPGGG